MPYALLTGVMAHATHYVSEIRHLHTELWAKALLALDDEYRLPRLGTLQLALLVFFSRPMLKGENAGQITIALARVSRDLNGDEGGKSSCAGDGSGASAWPTP